MDAQQVNLSDDELNAAVQAGWLNDPATLNKLDSDSRRRLVRVRGTRPPAATEVWQPTATDMYTRNPKLFATSDAPDAGPSPLAEMLGPLAHPQTIGDFAQLLAVPVDSVRQAMVMALGLRAARPPVGTAIAATGRGFENIGTALDKSAPAIAAADVLMHGRPVRAAAVAAAPTVAKAVGRGMQRVGTAIANVPEGAAVAQDVAPVAEAATRKSAPRTINDAMAEAMRARRAPSAPDASVPAAPTAPRARSRAPRPRAAASPSPNLGQANPEFAPVGGEAAYNAANPASPTPDAAARVYETMMAKNRLSAAETQLFLKLRQAGKSDAEAFATIDAARKLSTGLPNDAQVRSAVSDRNATGRWREE